MMRFYAGLTARLGQVRTRRLVIFLDASAACFRPGSTASAACSRRDFTVMRASFSRNDGNRSTRTVKRLVQQIRINPAGVEAAPAC